MIKIGYLGPEGSYCEIAAKMWQEILGLKDANLISSTTIPFLIQSIEKDIMDYSIVPLENSIEGNINITMDELIRTEARIVGEIIIKVDHCLAVRPETTRNKLQRIYSHSQALSQCYHFITASFPNALLIPVESTSKAAELVAKSKKNSGAICSKQAALNNNLIILAEKIQDYQDNKTRFVAVSKHRPKPAKKNKTTLVIALPKNKPGGLYRVLKEFADEQINLTKIESRPTKKELGEYLFFIECVGHIQDQGLNNVLNILSSKAALLKVLGSYPIAEEE
ncbi:MAG: prephenate dehydratase [Zhaonellaceae bacterium]|nr:prephenate dehydratase [Clostridia bacterium]